MGTGGDLIHEARLRAGLSQAELAARLRTSQPAIARWERGRVQPAMERVVEALRACGLALWLRVVERDDHDVELAVGNLRLTPGERVAQIAAMGAFAARARRARAGGSHRTRQVSEDAPDPPVFRPEEILTTLLRHGVEYVLIGGLAAVFHGSPHFTRDVDICPRRTPSNLAKLAAALDDLQARVRAGPDEAPLAFPRDAAFLGAVEILNTSTRAGDLDLSFEPSGTRGYDDLRRGAKTLDLDGIPVTVASLADVIRSKEAANRPKDHAALHVLRELLRRRGTSR